MLQARVDFGDLQLQHVIGEGSFGRVCVGLWRRGVHLEQIVEVRKEIVEVGRMNGDKRTPTATSPDAPAGGKEAQSFF